jgi:hypothetical protein
MQHYLMRRPDHFNIFIVWILIDQERGKRDISIDSEDPRILQVLNLWKYWTEIIYSEELPLL